MIQVYVLVTFWDDAGLHKAGTFTEVKEENFDPFYMQKVEGGGSVDAYTKAETDELLDSKQDDLTAGQNIQINNDVISATDTGDTVQVIPLITAGTQIANIKVNGSSNYVFAPETEGATVHQLSLNASEITDIATGDTDTLYDTGTGTTVDDQAMRDFLNAHDIIWLSDQVNSIATFVGTIDDSGDTTFVFLGSYDDNGTKKVKVFGIKWTSADWAFTVLDLGSGGGGGGATVTKLYVYDNNNRINFMQFGSVSTIKLSSSSSGITPVLINALKTSFEAGPVIIADERDQEAMITAVYSNTNSAYVDIITSTGFSKYKLDHTYDGNYNLTKMSIVQ